MVKAKLSDYQVAKIRKLHKQGQSMAELARWFRVAPSTVFNLVHGFTHKR